MYMYVTAQWNPLKTISYLRKSNIDGVDLIEAHYMHEWKYHNEPPVQLFYATKFLKSSIKTH
jgi:hypothetical protein